MPCLKGGPQLHWLPEMPPDEQQFSKRHYLGMRIAKLLCLVSKIQEETLQKSLRGAVRCPPSLQQRFHVAESPLAPLTAEMQEKASEGLQFPGPSCYITRHSENWAWGWISSFCCLQWSLEFLLLCLPSHSNISVFLSILVSLHQHILEDISILLSILQWLWYVCSPDCN